MGGKFRHDFDASVRAAFTVGSSRASADNNPALRYFSTPAPNAIEWCTRPEYTASDSIWHYYGSYEAVRDFFELLCPLCKKPGDDKVWEDYIDSKGRKCRRAKSREVLSSQPLLVWDVAEEDDRCPRCRVTRWELITDGLIRGYNQAHLVLGQRGGKSLSAGSYFGTYLEHVVLTHGHKHPKSLAGYFGSPPGAPFEITFLAASAVQSDSTVWAYYRAARAASPWFQKYTPFIASLCANQETPVGMAKWRYIENQTMIEHGNFNLLINSMNSNSHTSRGRTRIGSGIDELSYMHTGEGQFSAKEIYRAQENSLKTIRAATQSRMLRPMMGFIISISSPQSYDDYSMELLRVASDVPRMYTMHRPTWLFNPDLPEHEFEEEKRKDYINWKTNFAADPPAASSPLVPNFDLFITNVERTEEEARTPTVTFSTRVEVVNDQQFIHLEYGYAEYLPGRQYVICMDAGQNFDSYAGSCGHREINQRGEACTVFDWHFRIVPGDKQEVFFSSITPVIHKISERQKIMKLRFDRWQSVQTIQDIRALPAQISAMAESINDDDMIEFYRDAMLGLVKMLPRSPAMLLPRPPLPEEMSASDVAYHEWEKLTRDPKGRVYNENKGKVRGRNSDDVARTMAHVHRIVKRLEFVEKEHDRSREAKAKMANEMFSRWRGTAENSIARPLGMPGGRGW